MTDVIPLCPYLWGDWRCNANPDFYTGWCPACGADLWTNWTGSEWRPVCMNDTRACTREQIEQGAGVLLAAQRQRFRDQTELRGPMDADDPFNGLQAEDYIRVLTGREATRGFVQCPFHGDGDERTPSLHVTGMLWHCHGCHEGGTIYDFCGRLWGLEPRRDGFKEIRQRLASELLQRMAPAVRDPR
jgi:hypothetical protein